MNALPELPNPLKPGSGRIVGENIASAEYQRQVVPRGHKDFVQSRGELHTGAKNWHKWVNGYKEEESTTAQEWGTNLENLLFYPEQKDRFVLPPETYVNSKKQTADWTWQSKTCREWRKEQEEAGKTVVDRDDWTRLNNAIKFFWACAETREFVNCSKRQVMAEATYEDRETGVIVPLKVLIDLVPDRNHPEYHDDLGDLKTATNSDPFVWAREIHKWGYHWQAALYLDVWNIATGEGRTTFRHPVCESPPPWETTPYYLDSDFVTLGRMQYTDALKSYSKCLATGKWPGYADPESNEVYRGWRKISCEPWMVNRS